MAKKNASSTSFTEIENAIGETIIKLDAQRIREARPPCGWIIAVHSKCLQRMLIVSKKEPFMIINGMVIPVVVDKKISAENVSGTESISTEIWIGQVKMKWKP